MYMYEVNVHEIQKTRFWKY